MTQTVPPAVPQPYGPPYTPPDGGPHAPYGPSAGSPHAPYGPSAPSAGAPQALYGPPIPPPFGSAAPPSGYQVPRKKRTGLVVGSVIAGLLLLGGLIVGGVLLFGTKTLDSAEAQRQITALTEEQTGVAPTDVSCPADIEAEAGATFSCTGSLEGQPISFTVTQTDDDGNVEFNGDNTFVAVSAVQDDISAQVEQSSDEPVEVVTACETEGRTVLVDPADTQLICIVANANDPSLTATVTVSVAEDGSVTIDEVA